MSDENIELSDLSSVRALLKDARNRIIEAENRSKEAIVKVESHLNSRVDEVSHQAIALNNEQQKWIPLLTSLQKADENKRNLTLLLLVSFITNVATIIMSIFIWFIKSGGKVG